MGGPASGTITQNLPFGLSISAGDEVDIYASCNLALTSMTLDGEGRLVGFQSNSGTAQVSGTVPEPGTLAISLSLMAAAAARSVWRRRRA